MENKCEHGIESAPLAECSLCWLERERKLLQLKEEVPKGYKPLVIPDSPQGEIGC